jgi:hypothetical protein
MRQGKEMDTKFTILLVTSTLLVASIYSSSSTFEVFGAIVKDIVCSTSGDGKTVRCCGTEYDSKGNYAASWCTTCDNTNPPSNCTEREKARAVVNPGKVLSDVLHGGIRRSDNCPQLDRDVGPRGEFEELPESNRTFSEGVGPDAGGVFEQPESSNDD